MNVNCPYCELNDNFVSDFRTIVRFGKFHRTSDSKDIKRYRCRLCLKTFSSATKDSCFRQKKRQKNYRILELLASGISQRRAARIINLDRKTIARRLIFLGQICREKLRLQTALSSVQHMQFDDLETFEHSKCKPVSITLAVEGRTRRILGFNVAQMSAKGRLVAKSLKKYGYRRDGRSTARKQLFSELAPILQPGSIIKSDSNPYYIDDVKRYFPNCHHITCIGKRGAVTGQGELKKANFDPIFSLNHTCAMLRANICRLIRKTWCTTKKKERLVDHIAIYSWYHNLHLSK